MREHNLLDELVAISPGMEIWWDSSPIVFPGWCRRMLATAEPADRAALTAQLRRMVAPENPVGQLFRGVTSNPPLSLAALEDDPLTWRDVAAALLREERGLEADQLAWRLYREVVRRGSSMFLPLHEASGFQEGFLSAQVDPRSAFDAAAMLEQALDLHALNPNVMIKVPGTAQGYDVIEELTARGIATNNTLAFVLSQLLDGARSVMRGLARAEANRVDLSRWRSVITHMTARYGDLGGLRQAGAEVGVELSEGDIRLAEIAIFKKAYRLLRARGYRSKMLACSLRVGPTIDGERRVWHLEEMTGADIVVTCPPSLIEEVIRLGSPEHIRYRERRIEADPPAEVMGRLLRVPYFERAYDENGYGREEYKTHPALERTLAAFCRASGQIVAFAAGCRVIQRPSAGPARRSV